jgi:hypothetical protein
VRRQRFWRCFASSFYRDTDAVAVDLVETHSRMGIEPAGQSAAAYPAHRYTHHRIAKSQQAVKEPLSIDLEAFTLEQAQELA